MTQAQIHGSAHPDDSMESSGLIILCMYISAYGSRLRRLTSPLAFQGSPCLRPPRPG
jgi:hypothetical protein